MGNAAKVMTERVGGPSWKPRVVPAPKPPEPHEQLRAAVVDRLTRDTANFLGGFRRFLEGPERQGIANISVVISESTVTQDLWKEPRQNPEARAHLARTLGLAGDVDPAALVGALVAQVQQAFVEFEQSPGGVSFRAEYDALLEQCEVLGVSVILLGHDVGPMVPELARLGVPVERAFARSLLIDPRVIALVPASPELVEGQVLVSGASVSQLGTLVTQMRQLNPLLTNRQVRTFFSRVLTEGTERKSLGHAETELLRDWSRQLLRLHAVTRLVA